MKDNNHHEAIIILPISQFLPRIHTKLSLNNNLVLQAEPGAGKSTALPLSLLDATWLQHKKIIMLEPRRVAAKSIAHYLARQLGEKVGQRIGYQIKNERHISRETQLEIVTEGILTKRLQNNPDMADVGLIIFDEFHERSIHADLSLLLSLEIQQVIREDLKLLVMSATIDSQMLADYMGGADTIECSGRAYPVSETYQATRKDAVVDQVIKVLSPMITHEMTGDILVFLSGQRDIHHAINESKKRWQKDSGWLFLPLYGSLPLSQQEQVLKPNNQGKRRVIFATNIAETSLTIDGVTCVIDSGLEKVLIYDPTSGMTRLETTYIAKSSATQRKGRAGRTQAGQCVRLWSQQQQQTLEAFQKAEIMSVDLAGMILELCQWGTGQYDDIHWLTAPPKAHFDASSQHLQQLGLIDTDHKITDLGKKASTLGLPPRLARLLLKATGTLAQGIACELAALLEDRDIFIPHQGIDIIERLLAVQDYKRDRQQALKSYPIKRHSLEQLFTNARRFRRNFQQKMSQEYFSLTQLQDHVGKLLLLAYPDRLAKKRAVNQGRYQLSNGRGVFLFDDDALFNSDWLVVADCNAQKKEGRIYRAAALSYTSVLAVISHQLETKEEVTFDQQKQRIIALKTTKYGAITLNTETMNHLSPELFQQGLLEVMTETGLSLLNWTKACDDWLSRVQWLGQQLNDFPQITPRVLINEIDRWLLPYIPRVNSIKALKKIDTFELLLGLLTWNEQQLLARDAPTHYQTPSYKRVPIRYNTQQGPTVSVQLQELFGEITTPMLANHQVPIRFELLSPARRAIQITSDLGNFWKTSYFLVAKDMKSQYPKHRWPDKPLLEKAGRSIKIKKTTN